MEASCRRALEIGLPAIAFTEHADFVQIHGGQRRLDVAGYLEAVTGCRAAFPDLRVLSGVELGEPHWFAGEVALVLAAGTFDRVLGSVHCVEWGGRLIDASQLRQAGDPAEFMRAHLRETQSLVESAQPFQVLAHLDYPKRYWPPDAEPFRSADYEEETRAVLRSLAARGGVLEVNSTRGIDPARGLCPGLEVLRWWHQVGGAALSFGSDAHDPSKVAAGFATAAAAAEAAGFRPSDDPAGFWRR